MSYSIECSCGARTAFVNLAKPGEKMILFVGGAYKNGHVKTSTGPMNEAKERCLWCGKMWPENFRKALAEVECALE